jgi:hypothetical protein
MAHDIGTADFALEVSNVMTIANIRGLPRVFADLAEHSLLGLLLVDTTGHSAGCWLMMIDYRIGEIYHPNIQEKDLQFYQF